MEEQARFAQAVAWLINTAFAMGYQVTLGDCFRDPRVFGGMGERKGYGSPKSKHKRRLAIDLNLFKDGLFLQGTEDHRALGEAWERQYPDAVWGGRFNDGNHYQWGE